MQKDAARNPDARTTAPQWLGGLDARQVTRTLKALPKSLAFPSDLEARFEADTGEDRSRSLIWCLFPAVIVALLLLLADLYLLDDVFAFALELRVLFLGAFGLATLLVLRRNPRPVLREGLVAIFTLGTIVVIALLASASDNPARSAYLWAIAPLLVHASAIQGMRLKPSIVIHALGVLAALAAIWGFQDQLPATRMFEALVVAALFAFSFMAAYLGERGLRIRYLQSLLQTIQSARIEDYSSRDALTGLSNRRGFDRHVLELQAGPNPVGRMAVAIFDIDYFAEFNDTFGQDQGDECLKTVAAILNEAIRSNDGVYRFGGEEFVALFPNTRAEDAARVAERMRQAVENRAIPHRKPDGTEIVTVSIGIASGAIDGSGTLNALMGEADQALFRAQQGGRNRLVIATEAAPEGAAVAG